MDIGLEQLLFFNEVRINILASDLGKIAHKWTIRIAPSEDLFPESLHLALLQVRSHDGQKIENTGGRCVYRISPKDAGSYSPETFNTYAAHIIKKFPQLFS